MEDKEPVLVGELEPGIKVERVYRWFTPFRDTQNINVVYDEYFVTPLEKNVEMKRKYYVVKNLKAGQIINNLDLPLTIDEITEQGMVSKPNPDLIPLAEDFNGFDNWGRYNIGGLPDPTELMSIIEGAIDATLMALPIGCKDGWIITESL